MSRAVLLLFSTTLLVFAMGLLMIFNTTSAEVLDRFLDCSWHQAFIKQVLYAMVGVLVALAVWSIGYQHLLKMSGQLLSLFTCLLVLVFVPGVGQKLNGAHRWISLFGNSFQPSEFVKYLIPLYYIHKSGAIVSLRSFLQVLARVSVPLGLILLEPDNGTVAIILVSLMVLFYLTKLRWTYWVLPLSILILVGGVVASQMPHVADRLRIYSNPEQDLKGKGHQPYQAKIAAGSGRLWGKGMGESVQKLAYLPEARSDYIAAIFAEEVGFIGVTALILVYMLMGFAGLQIAQKTRALEGMYVASLFTFLICFQAFLNLGVVSGLLPSKGTNLPFFSHGGSSLLANMVAVSVILQIGFQRKKIP